jgi:hypothetical protein
MAYVADMAAADSQLARGAGVRSEMELPFAALAAALVEVQER